MLQKLQKGRQNIFNQYGKLRNTVRPENGMETKPIQSSTGNSASPFFFLFFFLFLRGLIFQ